MTDNSALLVGAMGAWLEARPIAATDAARARVSRLILDGAVLGVMTHDVDAPELGTVTEADRAVLHLVRAWAYPDDYPISEDPPPTEPTGSGPAQLGTFASLTSSSDAEVHSHAPIQAPDSSASDNEPPPADPAEPSNPSASDNESPPTDPAEPTNSSAPDNESPPTDPAEPSNSSAPDNVQTMPDSSEATPATAGTADEQSADSMHAAVRTTRLEWLSEETVLWAICIVAVVVLIVRRLI